ncbi:hypothetical protein GCM10010521_71600 [Streptomyces rameus]|uniref:Uncharacterized protein n=1 Tax=Streptomyces rameus TaxID=68261 RepID=A0ABN3V7Y4_9ACTN
MSAGEHPAGGDRVRASPGSGRAAPVHRSTGNHRTTRQKGGLAVRLESNGPAGAHPADAEVLDHLPTAREALGAAVNGPLGQAAPLVDAVPVLDGHPRQPGRGVPPLRAFQGHLSKYRPIDARTAQITSRVFPIRSSRFGQRSPIFLALR